MTRNQKIVLATVLTLAEIPIAAIVIRKMTGIGAPRPPVTLTGSVLKQSSDPRKQTPLSGVTVTVVLGPATVIRKSEPSGFFSIPLGDGVEKGRAVTLTFQQPDYETLEITASKPGDQLYLARMQPLQPELETGSKHAEKPAKLVDIKNVRIRYTFKNQYTSAVGSLAKQFEAPNLGNVACRSREPCSPDGRWKATKTNLLLDAEEGNEFHDVRVSCIAGPCAFTRIEADTFENPGRKITVSVLNWSDTANFLVEADVTRTMVADMVRQSYPFIVGQTMNFSLPPSSEGPSIEADLDVQHIVFPLGPALLVSWATCSVEVSRDGNKIYRCQLKPGYQFKE